MSLPQTQSLSGPLNCHLELEAPSGFGLHTYIQEMNFRGDEKMNDCSEDYVQFGRDVFAFTVYKSPLFCGHRPAVNFSQSEDVWKKFQVGQTHLKKYFLNYT